MAGDKEYWPTDGGLHHDVSPNALYISGDVSAFLRSDRKTILISSKGMGKTLMLRAKKKLLEDEGTGQLIIPRDSQADEPKLPSGLEKKGWSDIELWDAAWQASIVFSILTHQWTKLGTSEKNEPLFNLIDSLEFDYVFKADLKRDILNQSRNWPSYYLGEMVRRGVKPMRLFPQSIHIIRQISSDYVISGVSVFIDAFDQTLTKYFPHDLETWKNGQIGLLSAIHQLNVHNQHIKVYASIRQEAFAGFLGDDREVYLGRSVVLKYNTNELEKMFLLAAQKYNKCSTLKDFFKLEFVYNPFFEKNELPFRYIYRHSTGTPRSIMGLGAELSKIVEEDFESPSERTIAFRNAINEKASDNILNDYLLGQRAIFLRTLKDRTALDQLFTLMPANIVTGSQLGIIADEFANRSGIPTNECHPFCELFNIGLLGTYKYSDTVENRVQTFRKPYEFDWKQSDIVDSSKVYFFHPAMHSAVRDKRGDYTINRKVMIGDGYEWPEADEGVFPSLFLSHSSQDKAYVDSFINVFQREAALQLPSSIWYDKQSIKFGDSIYKQVQKGVINSALVLVFISKQSLESGWVEEEWQSKHQDEIKSGRVALIGIIIDDTDPKDLPHLLKVKRHAILPKTGSVEFSKAVEEVASHIASHLKEGSHYRKVKS